MKEYCFIITLLLFTFTVFPQSGKHEFGVNASPFLKQLLRSESFPQPSDLSLLIEYGPYMVTFRKYGKKLNFRAGAGFIFEKSTDEFTPFDNESKHVYLDLRIGLEKMFSISKTWQAYYGLDAVYSYKKEKILNFFDFSAPTVTKTAYGGGAVFGIQFFPLKNLSLSTESSFYFLHFQMDDLQAIDFDVFGNPIYVDFKTNGFQSIINLPLSLFLNYRF